MPVQGRAPCCRQNTGSPAALPVRASRTDITLKNRWDHVLARWGWRRNGHRVTPGLYSLGNPGPDAPVLVTANYTLSFDDLRSALAGRDAYLLVLDTRGINVWCAAGGGLFGTEELIGKIRATGLARVVSHRRLVLPQLSAPGVTAHRVRRETGFAVEFGPVRAADLPAFLDGAATPGMRRVTFTFRERLVLIPVELVQAARWLVPAALVLWLLGGATGVAALLVAAAAGLVAFPLLLPYIPARDFSSGGFVLGVLAAAPFAWHAVCSAAPGAWWAGATAAGSALLAMPPVTAYLALNFTGCTPFTSKSQVRREMTRYIPAMAWTFGAGLVLGIGTTLARVLSEG